MIIPAAHWTALRRVAARALPWVLVLAGLLAVGLMAAGLVLTVQADPRGDALAVAGMLVAGLVGAVNHLTGAIE